MYLNLLHRPEAGGKKSLFILQQEYAHSLNIKVTLMVSVQAMENQQLVDEIKQYENDYGDEIALWLWSFEKTEFGGNAPFWLLSNDNKVKGFQYSIDLFKEKFGKEPLCVGSYLMDKSSMDIVKKYSSKTTTVIAGCFEEGVKVFHGCNNSWYLFSEGVSWTAWYPSNDHSFRPAQNSEDWNGLVAIPHLSRDLALAYEGRNDFFASHPANIQRGLANNGPIHEYDYNLIDQYLMQEDFNNGYSFYNVHVSPGWLGYNANIPDAPEVSQKLYYETLEHLSKLRDEGKVVDMYMSEFGEWHKNNIAIGKPMVALGKEMLYGSGKHYFWYSGPDCRVLIDANQGGSIGDFRPYIGRFEMNTGPDTKFREIASYPYIIQSIYRTGTVNHFVDGSRTTLFVSDGNETFDLCYYRTKVTSIEREGNSVTVKLMPVKIEFNNGGIIIVETMYFFDANGRIKMRRIIDTSIGGVIVQEYLKGCYGYTEYAEDMHDITLEAGENKLEFDYAASSETTVGVKKVVAYIPAINTSISMDAQGKYLKDVQIQEGHLFEPYFTLKINYELENGRNEVDTWLTIRALK